MSANHAIQSCLSNLQSYLVGKVSGLTVLTEWPSANQKLTYPSLTLFSGKVSTMNLPAQIIAQGAIDGDNKILATEIIGEHDFTMQMDLWCANKFQRDVMLGNVLNAINFEIADSTGNHKPAGLSLQLTDYFNAWVRFDLDGWEYMDDEAAAERQERRAKIRLLVNCRDIRQRTYYAMTTIKVDLGVNTDGSNMGDNATGTTQVRVVP